MDAQVITSFICRHCYKAFVPKSANNLNIYCSGACYHAAKTRPLEDRFWDRVQKGDGCWMWTGTKKKSGHPLGQYYGVIGRGGRGGGNVDAHRLSWEIHYGPIPDGLEVRHFVCATPLCVRPDHLALGTHQQNMADMAKDGSKKGERHHGARLTDDQVRQIRQMHASGGWTQKNLGLQFDVSQSSIQRVVSRRGWSHVA